MTLRYLRTIILPLNQSLNLYAARLSSPGCASRPSVMTVCPLLSGVMNIPFANRLVRLFSEMVTYMKVCFPLTPLLLHHLRRLRSTRDYILTH